ncbi:MAG: glycosyltransferase family 4 protein [Deltaproteobacteria bacterium]|nr:glycosyltransferase family 4 protein [Deltaproteobacteria bacterium]
MKQHFSEVAAITSPGPGVEVVSNRDGITIYEVPMLRKLSPVADIFAFLRLVRIIRRLKPVIVHAHTPKAGFLGIAAASFCRVPVRVFTLHGLRSSGGNDAIKKLLVAESERFTCRFSQRVFVVSHSLLKEASEQGLCCKDKMKVLVNGTCNGIDAKGTFNPDNYPSDTRATIRQKNHIPLNAIVLGFVGRIVRDKGIGELIAAWQKLRDEFPDLYLLVVGDHETEDRVDDQLVRVLEQDSRIRRIGFVYSVAVYYLGMDIVVLPTYREGFPYVPLESGAMGLPIVASRVCGCVDAIEDERTGLLVPPRDIARLYAAIKRLIVDEPFRRGLGQAGRQRVLENFAQERLWEALLEEYVNLIHKSRSSSKWRPSTKAKNHYGELSPVGDDQAGHALGYSHVQNNLPQQGFRLHGGSPPDHPGHRRGDPPGR